MGAATPDGLAESQMTSRDRPFLRLSVRVRNGIIAELQEWVGQELNDPTREEIEELLRSGRIAKIQNLGKKSIQEVRDWLLETKNA